MVAELSSELSQKARLTVMRLSLKTGTYWGKPIASATHSVTLCPCMECNHLTVHEFHRGSLQSRNAVHCLGKP